MTMDKKMQGLLARLALMIVLALSVTFVTLAPVQAQNGDSRIQAMEFRDTTVGEAIRLIARLSGVNIFATREAARREFSMTVTDTTVRGVVASIARVSGLSYNYDENANAFMLMTNEQFASDVVITRNAETKVFTLRHQNVVSAALVVQSLFGDRVSLNIDTSDPDRLELSDSDLQPTRSISGGGARGGGGADSDLEAGEIDPLRLQELLGAAAENRDVELSELAARVGVEPPIYLTINREHNLLFARTADREAMRDIARIIRETDRPTKQVLLEVRVMSLDLDDDARSVFNFGLSGTGSNSNVGVNGATTVGPNGVSAGGFSRDGSGLFFQFINDNLLLQLDALERNNKAKTLSTPMLAASNNSPARLFVGTEALLARGFSSETSTGTTGATNTSTETEVELREVGQTLEILPRINADDTVTLVIEQENSTVVEEGGRVPVIGASGSIREISVDTINTARVGGTVTAKTGTTIAVGGLIRESSSTTSDRTPVLGNIPILGLMFRGDESSDTRSELILLITPHIYSGGPDGERLARARLARNSRNRDLDNKILSHSENGTPSVHLRGQQQHYVAMTRYAAAMRHGLLPPSKGAYRGIQPAPIQSGGGHLLGDGSIGSGGGGYKLFGGGGGAGSITAEPLESWNKRNLYVTAVVLTNTSGSAQAVQIANLRGAWIAATVESNKLAPRNQPGSRTYLYVISDRPFDDVIAELQAGGSL